VDGQCDKLVMVSGQHFITLTINICVQHGGHEALRRAGLSAVTETYCITLPGQFSLLPWDSKMSTSQRSVMLCGWGVKAGMV